MKNMLQLGKKAAFPLSKNISNKLFTSKLNNDSFLNESSGVYIEKMLELWKKDTKSVHNSWDIYFSCIEKGMDYNSAFQSPPTIDKGKFKINYQ
jgi:2-oxoglutarate dehydrogenase complex dehydrogenase (E1) component-like enzyme